MHAREKTMVKDIFARHTPIRPAGTEIRRKASYDASFVLKYERPEVADLLILLDSAEFYCILYASGYRFALHVVDF
jgi:hypothetical protein